MFHVVFTRTATTEIDTYIHTLSLHYALPISGSTLGNFDAHEAGSLLRAIGQTMGSRGGALIGIDLQKARSIVEPAYNDANGITAHFTLNLLVRLNRELGSDFDPDGFSHHATYIEAAGRIETFLIKIGRAHV